MKRASILNKARNFILLKYLITPKATNLVIATVITRWIGGCLNGVGCVPLSWQSNSWEYETSSFFCTLTKKAQHFRCLSLLQISI